MRPSPVDWRPRTQLSNANETHDFVETSNQCCHPMAATGCSARCHMAACRHCRRDRLQSRCAILADNCFECHGPDQESRQADLRLDVLDDELESVIVPGKPNVSVFIERLLSDDEDLVMPPPESKWRPTAKQIAILLLRRRICLLTSHLTLCSSLQPLINNVRINKRPILTKPFLSNLIEHPLL